MEPAEASSGESLDLKENRDSALQEGPVPSKEEPSQTGQHHHPLPTPAHPHPPAKLGQEASMDIPKPRNISTGCSETTREAGEGSFVCVCFVFSWFRILTLDLLSLLESLLILGAMWDRGSLLCQKSKKKNSGHWWPSSPRRLQNGWVGREAARWGPLWGAREDHTSGCTSQS